ncbi:MAG: S8 family serine peptidase [Lachnospiraceae bacterium]|nr:S8 family serine peptidase [Lachnospiraceae bacterium]
MEEDNNEAGANNQKREELLNLSLAVTPEIRRRSDILEVGYDASTLRWEVIVKYHGSLKQVENQWITVEELIAGYAIVTLPEALLEAFTRLPEVEYIEKPKRLIYDLYEAKLNSCVVPVARGSEGLTGREVLIAVLDSGIDYLLPDFQNEAGSRILYLWDQSLVPDEARGWRPPAGFRIGTEFTKAQIDEAIAGGRGNGSRREALAVVPQQDVSGHGTGVAAIAASSNEDPLLRGVAPDSELIVVKLGNSAESGFPKTTELMRGITYCLQKAELEERPLVINLSFGNTYGPHDGSSLLERFLDNASEIGRTTVCVGAGNEGSSSGHTKLEVGKDEPLMAELAVAQFETALNVQMWKAYEDVYQMMLISPDGSRYPLNLGNPPGRQTFTSGTTRILYYIGAPSPYSSLQELFFVFLPENQYLPSGIWKFILMPVDTRNGVVEFYLPSGAVRNGGTRFVRPDPNLTLTVPATAGRVISVAAYNDGLEAYADFSGRGGVGPNHDYLTGIRQKPDIAAPGVGLTAAASGGGTNSYTGTSFATPLVAGSAALLMEWGIIRGNDPFLYGEKLKACLRKGAKPIRGEAVYPNNRLGWGALCVADSFPA